MAPKAGQNGRWSMNVYKKHHYGASTWDSCENVGIPIIYMGIPRNFMEIWRNLWDSQTYKGILSWCAVVIRHPHPATYQGERWLAFWGASRSSWRRRSCDSTKSTKSTGEAIQGRFMHQGSLLEEKHTLMSSAPASPDPRRAWGLATRS